MQLYTWCKKCGKQVSNEPGTCKHCGTKHGGFAERMKHKETLTIGNLKKDGFEYKIKEGD